jgi:drug/metabolite transporter (DMT)-like permease
VLILALAAFFFSLFSLTGKAISDEIPPAQLIVVRSAIMLPVLIFWAVRVGQPLVGDRKLLLFLRGALGSLSLFLFFVALKRLPLTDTVLIFQAHPILVAALAPWFLKEPNRFVHWALIAVSLAGVALVVGPTGVGSWEGRLAALLCCALASVVYILVRYLRRSEPTITVALSFPAVSFLFFAPPFLFALPGFEWVPPTRVDWLLLAAMAGTAVAGQVLMTKGLGMVPAARGTAVSNLQIAFALFFGVVLLGEIPGWVTIAGGIVIVSAQVALQKTRPARRRPLSRSS